MTFDGSSYHRLLAHKVAAHYGLSSRAIVGEDGRDEVLVEKTRAEDDGGAFYTLVPPYDPVREVDADP